MNDINLLPHRRIAQLARRKRMMAWMIGASVYSALVALGAIANFAGSGPSRAAALKERTEIETSIESGKSEIAQLNTQLSDARHRLKTSYEVSKHPDWSILLKILADLRDPHMLLDRVELSKITVESPSAKLAAGKKKAPTTPLSRFVLKLSGMGQSLDAVPPFVLRLERTGLFSNVKLVESRVSDFKGRQVSTFRIDCLLADSEGTQP